MMYNILICLLVYVVGFMLTAFLTHLFKGEMPNPDDFLGNVFCTFFWPLFVPIAVVCYIFMYAYKLPMLLGEHCHKAVSKWGK